MVLLLAKLFELNLPLQKGMIYNQTVYANKHRVGFCWKKIIIEKEKSFWKLPTNWSLIVYSFISFFVLCHNLAGPWHSHKNMKSYARFDRVSNPELLLVVRLKNGHPDKRWARREKSFTIIVLKFYFRVNRTQKPITNHSLYYEKKNKSRNPKSGKIKC